MDGVLTHILVADLLALQLISIVVTARYRDRFRQRLAEPGRREQFYRRTIAVMWVLAAFVPAIVGTSADLSAADVGWAWPSGDGLDYLLAATLLTMLTVSAKRTRERFKTGQAFPGRDGMELMLPRTRREQWWAVPLSISAGITEEAIYRGLLIAVFTQLYDLPVAVAVGLSLALFVGGHAYQGWSGMLGVGLIGGLLTALYLMSGSLLLPIVVHAVQDLLTLRTTPKPEPEPVPAPSV